MLYRRIGSQGKSRVGCIDMSERGAVDIEEREESVEALRQCKRGMKMNALGQESRYYISTLVRQARFYSHGISGRHGFLL